MEIDVLFDRGADAYLTTISDSYLREFNSFIRESVRVDALIVKSIFEAGAALLPFQSGVSRFQLKNSSRTALLAPQFSIRLGGFALGYSREMLAAPLKSREFEKRFQTDVLTLKSLIKEVTLGSHSRTR